MGLTMIIMVYFVYVYTSSFIYLGIRKNTKQNEENTAVRRMSNFEIKSQSSQMWNGNGYGRRNSGIIPDGSEENVNKLQTLGGCGYRMKQRTSPTSPMQG